MAQQTGMVEASGHSTPSSGVHFYALTSSSKLSPWCVIALAGGKFSLLLN